MTARHRRALAWSASVVLVAAWLGLALYFALGPP